MDRLFTIWCGPHHLQLLCDCGFIKTIKRNKDRFKDVAVLVRAWEDNHHCYGKDLHYGTDDQT